MINNMKISKLQVFFLVIGGTYGVGTYLIADVIKIGGRSSWITSFGMFVILLPMVLLMLYISKDYPGKTLLEIIEITGGKVISKLITLLFILVATGITIANLSFSTNMTKNYMLPNTPTWITLVVALFLATAVASSGIEVLARMIVSFIPILILIYFILSLMGLKNFELTNLRPFDITLPTFLETSYLSTSIGSEVLLLFFIAIAAIKDKKSNYKNIFNSGILSFIILPIWITVSLIGTLSQEVATSIAHANLNLYMFIGIGRYIQGTELLLLSADIFMFTVKAALYLYCVWIALKHLLNNKVKHSKILLYISAAIVFITCLFLTNYNVIYNLTLQFLKYIVLPFGILVILITSLLVFNNKHQKV